MSAENFKDNNHRINKILQFLEKTPNDCFLLHALALEYQKLGNITKTELLFNKVLQIDENYIGTYYHLGKLYQFQNNNEKALQIFEKGVQMALKAKDNHSLAELRNAINMLEDED